MKSNLNLRNSRSKTERKNLDEMLNRYVEEKAKEYSNGNDIIKEKIDNRVHCFLYFVFQRDNNENDFNKYMMRYDYLKE